MDNVFVREGYELKAIVAFKDYYHAIIDRHTECDRYVFCFYYDITDGTWGQGSYFSEYSSACEKLASYLSKSKWLESIA